jgi:hypothetical protein
MIDDAQMVELIATEIRGWHKEGYWWLDIEDNRMAKVATFNPFIHDNDCMSSWDVIAMTGRGEVNCQSRHGWVAVLAIPMRGDCWRSDKDRRRAMTTCMAIATVKRLQLEALMAEAEARKEEEGLNDA